MSENTVILKVDAQMKTSLETVVTNLNHCRSLKLREIHTLPEWRSFRNIAIVGGGSSLRYNLQTLRKFETIIACGSAHDYLVQRHIIPSYTVVCDPDPLVLEYLKYPNKSCKYLISSHCDPSVFAHLKNYGVNTVVWHCAGTDQENTIYKKEDILISGGCTVGTRAITIAINFGFPRIHLFGFDTCVHNGKSHAYSFSDPEKEQLTDIREVDIQGHKFHMAGYMMAQFFDFQHILKTYGQRTEFIIHGKGALYTLMELARKATTNG